MSSLATAPWRAASRPEREASYTHGRLGRLATDSILGLTIAGGLALVAFLGAGGTDLAPNTWAEIGLTVTAGGLACLIITRGYVRRAGLITLALFAAVAALTFASIAWSVEPSDSWNAANQTLSYLAAFAAGVALSHLVPGRLPALVGAIALAANVVAAFALLVKVFPGTFDPIDPVGRLRAPFDYWNATGLIAAMGLPVTLWAGARRERARALRALSVPAVAILISVLVLSSSRGAVIAAVLGLGFWFTAVPLRLRGAAVLLLGGAGAALICAWALSTDAITQDHSLLRARVAAGHGFGVVLVLVLALLVPVGLAAAFAMDRVTLDWQTRRRAGTALVALLALVPLGGIAALAASSRGLSGEVSHLWSTLTNTKGGAADTPGRLVQLSNSRPRYWSEGITVGDHAPLLGVGALGYGTARTRYTGDRLVSLHAHSYAVETYADFGVIGLALNLALLVSWAIAARRTLRSESPGESPSARLGLLTLLAVVVTFGVHSSIDWTWFVPGTAVPALLAAGWLAGRGRTEATAPATRLRLPGRQAALAAALCILAVTLAACWVIWQPLRSAQSDDSATSALAAGNPRAALSDARAAAGSDPVAIDPLFQLAAIYTAIGDQRGVHSELVKAVSVQPSNPATWQRLGQFDLAQHHPVAALGVLRKALALDRSSQQTQQLIATARARLVNGGT